MMSKNDFTLRCAREEASCKPFFLNLGAMQHKQTPHTTQLNRAEGSAELTCFSLNVHMLECSSPRPIAVSSEKVRDHQSKEGSGSWCKFTHSGLKPVHLLFVLPNSSSISSLYIHRGTSL